MHEKKDLQLGYEIKTLDNMIHRMVMNISIRNGMDQVTVMHGWIIAYLYENQDKDIYQKDIENTFRITRSTVTNILKLMEKKGYIRRISVEKDARLKKIILTPMAAQIQRQNFSDIHNIMEKQMTRDIPPEELACFLRVLGKMKQNLENIKEE